MVRWICWKKTRFPAVAVVIPKLDFQGTDSLNTLRDRITRINGIDEVRMDDSWFARLAGVDRAGRDAFRR